MKLMKVFLCLALLGLVAGAVVKRTSGLCKVPIKNMEDCKAAFRELGKTSVRAANTPFDPYGCSVGFFGPQFNSNDEDGRWHCSTKEPCLCNQECAPGCKGDDKLGDGVCQAACNVPACNYDGGDCTTYKIIKSGKCENPIRSQDECRDATKRLGFTRTFKVQQDKWWVPTGCFVYRGCSRLPYPRFNTAPSSSSDCKKEECVCRGSDTPAPAPTPTPAASSTEDDTAAPIVGSGPSQAAVDFKSVGAGYCRNARSQTSRNIYTEKSGVTLTDCQNWCKATPACTAIDFGVGAECALVGDSISLSHAPSGKGFVTGATSTGPVTKGSGSQAVICYLKVNETPTPAPAPTPAGSSTEVAEAKYYKLTSGLCPALVETVAECRTALQQLGLAQNVGSRSKYTEPLGCGRGFSGFRFNTDKRAIRFKCSPREYCICREECAPGCKATSMGDGTCQAACNVAACKFDRGDCSKYRTYSGADKCDNPITDPDECAKAVKELGYSNKMTIIDQWAFYPQGCMIYRGCSRIPYPRFNKNTRANKGCNSKGQCVCGPSPTAPAASAASADPSSRQEEDTPAYVMQTSGNCASRVTTPRECEDAMAALQGRQSVSKFNDRSYVQGCYVKEGQLWFNSVTGSSNVPCTTLRSCLCKAAEAGELLVAAPAAVAVSSKQKHSVPLIAGLGCAGVIVLAVAAVAVFWKKPAAGLSEMPLL
eukprot:NODE_39_length_2346_cov_323.551154_g34_i0.p1 GENE.NODE_39_length_2346_cov_323.551154_g34_i0~~NODE_39_length_2346_cov_323.551154_g34_i0.p1  ORF type:complete len:707 (-),score=155.08 NODE_39_length_2346_cov_323.551154_g34_i0:171-2291(-)